MRADGTAVLVFTRGQEGTREVLAADWTGTDWSMPVLVSADPFAADPRVAFDAMGRAVVVWWRADGAGRTGLISRRISRDEWSPASAFCRFGEEVSHPAVAFDRSTQRLLVGYQVRLPLGTGIVIVSRSDEPESGISPWMLERKLVLDHAETGQMRFVTDAGLTLAWTEAPDMLGWITLTDGAWFGPYRANQE